MSLKRPFASFSAAAAAAAALAIPAGSSLAQAPAAPAPPAAAPAGNVAANINITPKRLTFGKGRRAATVFVYNQGSTEATFDISLVDRVMLPDGQIIPLDEAKTRPDGQAAAAAAKSAQNLILISPRRVTVAPGKGQTVRVRVTDPSADAAPAEYRTHLTVTTIPPRNSGVTAEQAAGPQAAGQLSFQINALFGLSIPLIVRNSDPDVRAAIQNVRAETVTTGTTQTPVLAFDLVRQGASSLFGNLEIRRVGDTRGEPLGVARGVGVYPEIERRVVRIPLSRPLAAGEKVEVTFTDDDTSPGKVLAKTAAP